MPRQDTFLAEAAAREHGKNRQRGGPDRGGRHQQVVQAIAASEQAQPNGVVRSDQFYGAAGLAVLLPVAGQVVRHGGTSTSQDE